MASTSNNGEQLLAAGSFYGSVQRKSEHQGAIFTELQHVVPRKLPKHSHQLAFFALVLRGYYGERYVRQQKQFGPFSVMFRPAGVPHQDEIGPSGLRLFEIELKPSWQARMADYPANLNLPFDDERGGEFLWLVVKLYRESMNSGLAESLSVESLLAELVAQAARLPEEKTRQAPAWLQRAQEKIRAEHCEKLTLEELSQEARVHPVHLSRVFRRFTGQGISEYVHRLRIRTGCERLLAPDAALADVSLSTGFADQSHFCRSFRKFTGVTPGVFRASLGLNVGKS